MVVDEGNLPVVGVERYVLTSSRAWVKGLRRIGGGDQADIVNLIQNSQNTSVHFKGYSRRRAVKDRTRK